MTPIRSSVRKRILAGGAAIVLSLSVVACSEAEDAANEAESAISDATEENSGGGAGDDASTEPSDDADATSDTASTETTGATEGNGGDAGDTTEVESADGSTMAIPTAVAEAAESNGFANPESMDEGSDGEVLVAYENGQYIVHSDETGAQPLVGMIAETWMNEGGFDAPVGLPTAPEEANEDGNGWMQEFTQGTIAWVADDSGEYSEDVQTN